MKRNKNRPPPVDTNLKKDFKKSFSPVKMSVDRSDARPFSPVVSLFENSSLSLEKASYDNFKEAMNYLDKILAKPKTSTKRPLSPLVIVGTSFKKSSAC